MNIFRCKTFVVGFISNILTSSCQKRGKKHGNCKHFAGSKNKCETISTSYGVVFAARMRPTTKH
jgi:hypothetical protein